MTNIYKVQKQKQRKKQRQGQEQPQVLRLTTPNLHPKEQRPLFGDPGTEKRLGPRSLRMTDIYKVHGQKPKQVLRIASLAQDDKIFEVERSLVICLSHVGEGG
jgi:hypothetical protein